LGGDKWGRYERGEGPTLRQEEDVAAFGKRISRVKLETGKKKER